jgi:hypothetical protein
VDADGALWRGFNPSTEMPADGTWHRKTTIERSLGQNKRMVELSGDCVDRVYRVAFQARVFEYGAVAAGNYSVVGPGVFGNPHRLGRIRMVGWSEHWLDAPTSLDGLRQWLADWPYKGVVFTLQDKLFAVRRTDVGLAWPTDQQ